MAKDLKRFVNLTFLKTIDLELMRRLLERHDQQLKHFDLTLFGQESALVRKALQNFFAGPEENYPEGLVADLHRIAELANENGLRLLLERAAAANVQLVPAHEASGKAQHLNPKHIALRTFLEHPKVFEAASDLRAIEVRSSLTEFSGPEEDVRAEIDDAVKEAFEHEVCQLLPRNLMGGYCRIGWYEDEDELNIVVTHGDAVVITPAVKDGVEELLTYQPVGHAHLAYDAVAGRVKVGGIAKALRPKLAEVFAATVLGRPGFFAGEDSQDLYTLEPIEQKGLAFMLDHGFDPGISRAAIVEVEAHKRPPEDAPEGSASPWSVLVRDRSNALERLGEVAPRVTFGKEGYRINYILIAVTIETGTKRPAKVRVKVKPPTTADFKRHRYEGRIMELLRRNKLCRERRKPGAAAAAAE